MRAPWMFPTEPPVMRPSAVGLSSALRANWVTSPIHGHLTGSPCLLSTGGDRGHVYDGRGGERYEQPAHRGARHLGLDIAYQVPGEDDQVGHWAGLEIG